MRMKFIIYVFPLIILSCFFQLNGQEITGPEKVMPGTLAVYEIVPPQMTAWTITPVEESENACKVDSSSEIICFATPNEGRYTIVAAIIVDGKPTQITRTVINERTEKVDPSPNPEPDPLPNSSLSEWIRTQLQVLVQSNNRDAESAVVGRCFEEIAQKIESGPIRTAQNARSQLQITLTSSLADVSSTAMTDWQPFLTELSKKIESELGKNRNDVMEVKKVFEIVSKALGNPTAQKNLPATPVCPHCKPSSFMKSNRIYPYQK